MFKSMSQILVKWIKNLFLIFIFYLFILFYYLFIYFCSADSSSESISEKQVLAEKVNDLSAPLTKTDTVPQSNEELEKAENADKAAEAGAGGEKAEDFPSYTEWTKKVLAEEKNKQDGELLCQPFILSCFIMQYQKVNI